MNVIIATERIAELAAECVVLTIYEGQTGLKGNAKQLDQALGNRISELIADREIKGKFGEISLLYNWGAIPAKRTLLLGLGPAEKATIDKYRHAFGELGRYAARKGIRRLTIGFDGEEAEDRRGEPIEWIRAAAEGIALGSYRFDGYKQKKEEFHSIEEATVVVPREIDQPSLRRALDRAIVAAKATHLARDLVNEPSNHLTPAKLAERAEEIASRGNVEVQTLNKEDLERLGMGALLAVGRAGANEPRMIVLRYNGDPESKETIGLVGKGITFDTGGIQVKPDEGMEEMKTDMAGAAAVIAAFDAIAALRPRANAIGVIPACENMIAGNNLKPADVITSFSGKTIEIMHTDAEGRLILADGVAYAKHLGATKIVDVATLTGSVISALGYEATGLIANDASWADAVKKAAEATGEKVWELPNFEEYQEYIESDIADLKNDAGRPAGCIQGGIFIGAFAEDTPWVHLDIAGTSVSKKDRGYHPAGATGVMTRALVELIVSHRSTQ